MRIVTLLAVHLFAASVLGGALLETKTEFEADLGAKKQTVCSLKGKGRCETSL